MATIEVGRNRGEPAVAVDEVDHANSALEPLSDPLLPSERGGPHQLNTNDLSMVRAFYGLPSPTARLKLAKQIDFEDVFGNQALRLALDQPYTELAIEAESEVETLDIAPFAPRPPRVRSTIPLIWMPRQRQMLQPYLLPAELPDSELEELVTYAMSFAERNDFDLLATLLDINTTIHREFRYQPGVTTVYTTPFQVYQERRGVCQDFTNLFICLARLIGVPARYVCGYFYTGPRKDGAAPEASHAWVQVYLPERGWRGFDPTNGVVTRTDHVRVAVGRLYVDATPTSGTIYLGGGGRETLEAQVFVEDLGPASKGL